VDAIRKILSNPFKVSDIHRTLKGFYFLNHLFMAENKKSIIVYADWLELFETLTDDEAGKLIKHFFKYVNDQNPIAPDRLTELSFIPIKQSLKRDLIKWENTLEGRSRAGKASAEKRKQEKEAQQNPTHSTSVDFVQHTSTNSTDSVSVSVSDSVTTSTQIIKFDDAVKICLFDDDYSEDIERAYKIPRDKVRYALTDFQNHCKTTGDNQDKTLNQFKKHFTNWVRIKKTMTT
jgi:hypothetical protein